MARIVDGGGRAEARELDVSDPDACRALVDGVVGDHGRLDVLANVAGVLRFAHATEHTRADWEQTLAVNLSGPWFLMQAALPHLEATRGNIVNVASAAGLVGQAYTSAYCASKGGLVLLTKSLAVEYAARKVRVNCVCPGQVDTNLLADFAFPEGADQRLLDKLLPLVRGAARGDRHPDRLPRLRRGPVRHRCGLAHRRRPDRGLRPTQYPRAGVSTATWSDPFSSIPHAGQSSRGPRSLTTRQIPPPRGAPQMRAIVFDGKQAAVATDVEVRDTAPTEVKVRMVSAGVCHSDLSVIDGTIPFPPPVVMGHEGAGIIEEVGSEVHGLAPGDHVVMTTLAYCGSCSACDTGNPTWCRRSFGQLNQPFTVNGENRRTSSPPTRPSPSTRWSAPARR